MLKMIPRSDLGVPYIAGNPYRTHHKRSTSFKALAQIKKCCCSLYCFSKAHVLPQRAVLVRLRELYASVLIR